MADTKPATPAEAEELAKAAVQAYLNSCHMTDGAQVANYLMKLCSVAGVLMACAEGSYLAAMRLRQTGDFIEINMPAAPAVLRPVQ